MQQHHKQNQCLSCGQFLYGKYCSHCGEKLLEPHERSLGRLVGEFLGTLFNFDNKFFKSIRQMLRRPGQLSLDYANGRRRPYLRPSGLFLILTAIYFIFAPFEIFVAPLNTHMQHTNYQAYASRIVQEKLAEDKLTLEELNQSFNQRTASLAKWLSILKALIFLFLIAQFAFVFYRLILFWLTMQLI